MHDELIQVAKHLYDKELLSGTDGNISIRYKDNYFVTRSGVCKKYLKQSDILMVDKTGRYMSSSLDDEKNCFHSTISSEFKTHLALYEARPDINCIIHGHPINVNAITFAARGHILTENIVPEIVAGIGKPILVDYRTPGSEALAQKLKESVRPDRNVYVLLRHGAIVGDTSLWEACFKLEKIEYFAKILNLIYAKGSGNYPLQLDSHEIKDLSSYDKRRPYSL